MLHSHAHYFLLVHNQLHFSFQKNNSIQNEVEVEGLRIMSDHDYLFYPTSRFLQISQHDSHRVVPERVYKFATLNAILFHIRYVVAFRTELLQAYEIWYVLVCPMRSFRILRRLRIIKFVQHNLAGGRHVHQWMHKAKMAGLFVLFTCSTEPFFAFVLISGDQSATRIATQRISHAFVLLSCVLFLLLSKYV